jgi:hypothetical protein
MLFWRSFNDRRTEYWDIPIGQQVDVHYALDKKYQDRDERNHLGC